MDLDWSRYYLRDIPFVELPTVNPTSSDLRINGRIFSREGFEAQYQGLLGLIQREKGLCYVRAESDVLGTGKSALLAAVYWDLKDDKKKRDRYTPVWADVETPGSISQLLGRVLDAMVTENVIDSIKSELKDLTPSSISSLLSKRIRQPSPSAVLAVSRILQMPTDELSMKYVNIRRSISMVSAVEVFQYILTAYGRTEEKRRVVVFINQFEEYVRTQRGIAGLRRLGEDMNDLIRSVQNCGNITFVLTLYPSSEAMLQTVGPIIETFGTIRANSVTTGELDTPSFLAIAKAYLDKFRTENAPRGIGPLHPFDEDVVTFFANECNGIPRNFIRYLHNALVEAALAGHGTVTLDFVKSPEILPKMDIK